MFLLVVTVLTVLVFLDLLPPGQELYHWLVLVRVHVRVSYFDVNDGVDLTIPYNLDHHVPPRVLVIVITLTYL